MDKIRQRFLDKDFLEELGHKCEEEIKREIKNVLEDYIYECEEEIDHEIKNVLEEVDKFLLKGTKSMRNQVFVKWLRSLGPEYLISADNVYRPSSNYSRFSSSEQFYSIVKSSTEVHAVAMTETEREDKLDEEEELDEDEVKEACKWQLIANMSKTAADIATFVIQNGRLVDKITVYGFLIDYGQFTATEFRKLVFDFTGKVAPVLTVCSDNAVLGAKDAIERVFAIVDKQ